MKVFAWWSISSICLICCNTAIGQIARRDSLLNVLKNDPAKGKIETLLALSKWFATADFPKSVSYANDALQLAWSDVSQKVKANAITNRAMLYWHNGEYPLSIDLNKKSIQIRETIGDHEGIAENRYNIAMNYYYSADYRETLEFHKHALEGYRRSGNRRMEAEVLNRIGLVYHQMGNYPEAAHYLHEFWKVRQDFSGFQGRTYNLGVTSPYFRSKEFFEKELELQLKALKELERNGGEEDQLLTYLNIADTYKELGILQDALQYHRKAVKHAEVIGKLPGLNYLGNAYRAVGQLDSAFYTHTRAIEMERERGTQINYMFAHRMLGEDLFMLGRPRQALEYYSKGLLMTRRMGNKLDEVLYLKWIANILVSIGEHAEARSKCAQILEMASRIKAKSKLRDGYLQMANICSMSRDFEAASYYQEKHRLLADSLIAGEADLQFAQMQAQFELDKKTEDIKQLNQEKEIQEAKIRNKDLLIYSSLTVLLLSILLAISIFWRFRQKNRANKILQTQKHQIEVLLSEVHHRVKNNLQVISSLLSIQSNQLKNKDARMAVLEGQSRVQAMGLIHENIYKAENFAFIQMEEYLRKLCLTLIGSFGKSQIELKIDANHLSVDVDTAIPLGLIINELVTNSLKHAFNKINNPCISIALSVDDQNQLALDVRDNGRGFLIPSTQSSFGLKLVKELTFQLGGTIDFAHGAGFSVLLKFKKFKLAA